MDVSCCVKSHRHLLMKVSSFLVRVSIFPPLCCCSSPAGCCCYSWVRPGRDAKKTMQLICRRPGNRLIDVLIYRPSSRWTRLKQLDCRTYVGAYPGSCGSAYVASCCPVKSTVKENRCIIHIMAVSEPTLQ